MGFVPLSIPGSLRLSGSPACCIALHGWGFGNKGSEGLSEFTDLA